MKTKKLAIEVHTLHLRLWSLWR